MLPAKKVIFCCWPNRSRHRSGAAAAELAVVLPIILLMFFIAVDYCRLFACAEVIQNSAHVAALYASETVKAAPATEIEKAAKQAAVREGATLSPPLQENQVTVKINPTRVTVTVEYKIKMVMQNFGLMQEMTITKTATLQRSPGTEE